MKGLIPMFILKINEVNANSIYNTDISYIIAQPDYSYSLQRGDEFKFDVVNGDTSIKHPLTNFRFVVTNVYYGTALQPGNVIISFRAISNDNDVDSSTGGVIPEVDTTQVEVDQDAE